MRWLLRRIPRHIFEHLAMVLVVLPPVLEFLANARADLDVHVVGDGHVATIKQGVQIGSEEKAVRYKMRPALRITP